MGKTFERMWRKAFNLLKYGDYSEENIDSKMNIKERIEEGKKKAQENNKYRESINKTRKYNFDIW